MAFRSANINVMVRAAEKAGRALIRDFGEVEQLQVSRKGPADFVSTADTKAEKIVRRELEKARPDFGFLMEEGGAIEGRDKERRWLVDPLDGTTNFLHGLPHFAVSIGLEERGEITAGVVYDPIKDEIFWAEKGAGAYLGDRRMRVSGRTRLPDSLLATGIPYLGRQEGAGHRQFLAQMAAVMAQTSGVRRWGAAALDLAYVAAGRYDGFWESGLSPWDVAAGTILVREAGGYVSQIDGRAHKLDSPSILAANDRLHRDFVKLLSATG
ncbi:MAG: inositol monophosphatase [Rhodospirillales bacterium]|nr:MAG: inositol monophosphatase [Rhodospirillales bacterium]